MQASEQNEQLIRREQASNTQVECTFTQNYQQALFGSITMISS